MRDSGGRAVRLGAALAGALLSAGLIVSAAAAGPRLAVLIVVDQMRADYIDRFGGEWTSGLKRLVTDGAWLTHAAYPYLMTVTCAGHATIATGAFPNVHGVMQNAWFDRTSKRLITCTEDSKAASIGYDKPVSGGNSAAMLRVPTFAEEMRRQRGARVVSLALKARSAIMLAGHAGDAITWKSDAVHGWQTSTAFAPQMVPEVRAFVSAHPIEADYGRVWDRLLPPDRYPEADAGSGEAPPMGWTNSFPHALRGSAGASRPDNAFYQQWERSPFADEYLGRMAAALAESMQLGTREGTDVLAVSFSTSDLLGHGFGPRSQEIHDLYLRLDQTVGALLDRLDVLVGRNQYVVVLASDHGVQLIPEQRLDEGREGGRLSSTAVTGIVEAAAQAAGTGRYVARVNSNDIYFEPGMYERLTRNPAALDAVITRIAAIPGVRRVFTSGELTTAAAARHRDPLVRAAALSYVKGRSGDLVILPGEGWMFGAIGTTHGSTNADDQRVPIIFFGPGIRSGRYDDAATPADIAPTLARIFGVTMPKATGRPIRAVLNRASRTPRP